MKLVLHFDINGTIIGFDSTETGTPNQNANLILAKNIYGQVVENKWILNQDIYNEIDSITYYNYLKTLKIPNAKQKAYEFTNDNEPGVLLRNLLEIIETKEENIFDSFNKVLELYPEAIIVLRSFGRDIESTVNKIKKTNPIYGKIIHEEETKVILDKNIPYTFNEFNDLLKVTSNQIFAIQEDYNHWNNNNRDKKHGKLMMAHEDMLQIFFDDNEWVNIINNKIINKSHYIKVNTIRALIEPNYFADLIQAMQLKYQYYGEILKKIEIK